MMLVSLFCFSHPAYAEITEIEADTDGDGHPDFVKLTSAGIEVLHPHTGETSYYNYDPDFVLTLRTAIELDGSAGREIVVTYVRGATTGIHIIHDVGGRTSSYDTTAYDTFAFYSYEDIDGLPGDEIVLTWTQGASGGGIDILHDRYSPIIAKQFDLSGYDYAIYTIDDMDGETGKEIVVTSTLGATASVGILHDSTEEIGWYSFNTFGNPDSPIYKVIDTDGQAGEEIIVVWEAGFPSVGIGVIRDRTGENKQYNFYGCQFSINSVVDTDGQAGSEIIVVWDAGYPDVGITVIHDATGEKRRYGFYQLEFAIHKVADTDGQAGSEIIVSWDGGMARRGIKVIHDGTGEINDYNLPYYTWSISGVADTDGHPGNEIVFNWAHYSDWGIGVIDDGSGVFRWYSLTGYEYSLSRIVDTDGLAGEEIVVVWLNGASNGVLVIHDARTEPWQWYNIGGTFLVIGVKDYTHNSGADVCYKTGDVYNVIVDSIPEVQYQTSLCTDTDLTAPSTDAAPSGGTYNNSVMVSLLCGDDTGCGKTFYCAGAGCTPSTEYAGQLTISTSTDFRFYSEDLAGNTEGIKTETYTVQYTVKATAGVGGSITPSGAVVVDGGSSQSFTITPHDRYVLGRVVVDGVDKGAVSSYTIEDVVSPHEIYAEFYLKSSIAAGRGYTVALKPDGTVWAWGDNEHGQLGNGTITNSITPVQVKGPGGVGYLTDVVEVAIGGEVGEEKTTYALKADGTLWAWGDNETGFLGNGTQTDSTTPLQVKNAQIVDSDPPYQRHLVAMPSSIVSISGGGLACAGALDAAGTFWMYYAAYDLFPDWTFFWERYNLPNAIDVHCQWGDNYALMSDGTVWIGSEQIEELSNIIDMDIKGFGAIFLRVDGTVWVQNYGAPVVEETGITNAVAISTGYEFWISDNHHVILKSDGTVWASGFNTYGQLGVGNNTGPDDCGGSPCAMAPVQVKGPGGVGILNGIVAIDAGRDGNTFAVKSDGTVWAWGRNDYGQLGDGTYGNNSPTPVQVQFSFSSLVDTDSDGVLDSVDSAPLDPENTGTKLALSENTQEAGLRGNGYGDDSYYSVLAATFEGDGTDRLLHVQGYDVDYTDEIGVYLNSVLLGYLSGTDNAPGPDSLWWLTPEMQALGENRIEFRVNDAYPGETWGVQRLGIYTAGVELGNMASLPGDTSHAGGFELHVEGAEAKLLELSVWDDSAVGGAVEVFVNDASVGVMPVHTSSGWGMYYQLLLPSDYLYIDGGDNIIFIENSLGAGNEWGVKLNAVKTVEADAEYGYSGGDPGNTTDGVALLVPAYGGDREISVQFRDVSASEVEITSSDGFTDYAPQTEDWGDVYTVYSGPGQLGRVDFNNVNNPPNMDPWGVRVTGERFVVPFASNPAISGGWGHTLALKSDGTVQAWGNNNHGRLGDGTTAHSGTPVRVIKDSGGTALNGVVAVSAGGDHSAALAQDGTVWTWGRNNFGQLGLASPSYKTKAVQVPGLTNAAAVAAGFSHTVALRSDGTVWTWGRNNFGQLGIGNTTGYSSPVQVEGLFNVVAIASGGAHVLALRSDGTVWGWGYNNEGELGDSSTTTRLSPVEAGITNVRAIYAGTYHSFAIKSNGEVWAWGYNNYGQLGDGTTANQASPVRVKGVGGTGYLSGVVEIVGGNWHTIALKDDGSVLAWGYNYFGQLGDSTTTDSHWPKKITEITDAIAIAAGSTHTTVLRSDGTAWAWGWNGYGQIGNGNISGSRSPLLVENLTPVNVMAAGYMHTLGIAASDGTVWGWGINTDGALGDGTRTNRYAPVQAFGIANTVDIDGGFYHSVALKDDETVWTWGSNAYGQLGDGSTVPRRTGPVQVTGLTNAVDVAAGGYHTATRDPDGVVWTWGYNGHGQLGNTTTDDSRTPVEVTGIPYPVDAIAAGGLHTVAIDANGGVWTWGDNSKGQLGLGDESDRYSPVQVSGITNAVAVAAGYYHTVALDSDGKVWAWGYNWQGQVGDGSNDNSSTPVEVSLTDVIDIASGSWHTMALKSNGEVWAWGYNEFGQLGDGTVENRNIPVLVNGLSGVDAVFAGGFHSGVLELDGSVLTWGWNVYGQLGKRTDPSSPTVTQFSQ
jgi:alpha-tubulin suppressor-like RCC1 family protein